MNLKKLTVSVSNVNLRRERAGKKNGPIAVDVSIAGFETPEKKLEGIFSTKASYEKLLGGLFDKDGELRTSDLRRQTLNIEGHGMVLSMQPLNEEGEVDTEQGPIDVRPATIDNFVIDLKAGGLVDWSARVRFLMENVNPSLEDVAELMRTDIVLDASPAQRALELDEGKGAGKGAGKKESPAKPGAKKNGAPKDGMPSEIH